MQALAKNVAEKKEKCLDDGEIEIQLEKEYME